MIHVQQFLDTTIHVMLATAGDRVPNVTNVLIMGIDETVKNVSKSDSFVLDVMIDDQHACCQQCHKQPRRDCAFSFSFYRNGQG